MIINELATDQAEKAVTGLGSTRTCGTAAAEPPGNVPCIESRCTRTGWNAYLTAVDEFFEQVQLPNQ
jgi:hypothetical protein